MTSVLGFICPSTKHIILHLSSFTFASAHSCCLCALIASSRTVLPFSFMYTVMQTPAHAPSC